MNRDNRKNFALKDLALITGISDAQIRKDISNFDKVGALRIRYKTVELNEILRK